MLEWVSVLELDKGYELDMVFELDLECKCVGVGVGLIVCDSGMSKLK